MSTKTCNHGITTVNDAEILNALPALEKIVPQKRHFYIIVMNIVSFLLYTFMPVEVTVLQLSDKTSGRICCFLLQSFLTNTEKLSHHLIDT